MIKLWGKIIKNHKIVLQEVALCTEELEYQEQLKHCILELSYTFDIQKPYWLEKNMNEYNKIKKTSFTQDNFMEEIDFDRFEIEVIEEK